MSAAPSASPGTEARLCQAPACSWAEVNGAPIWLPTPLLAHLPTASTQLAPVPSPAGSGCRHGRGAAIQLIIWLEVSRS